MVAPTTLPGRAFQNTAKTSDLILGWRASDLALDAYTGQTATYSRASSGGYVVGTGSRQWLDTDNQLRLTGPSVDDVPGWEWVQNAAGVYVPALTLAGALTNLVTDDDLNNWTKVNTPTVASTDGPDGGTTSAYSVEDDSGAQQEYIYTAPTFTGDGVKTIVFVLRENTMASSGHQSIQLYDATAAAHRLNIDITAWTDGVPTLSEVAGSVLGTVEVGPGWWAVACQTASVTAANTHEARIQPAKSISATSSIDIFRVNAYDSAVPLPKILDASVAHSADSLYWDFVTPPRSMTVYVKFVERGTKGLSHPGLYRIGSATNAADPRVAVRVSGSKYQAEYDDGTTNAVTVPGVATDYGNEVEHMVTVSTAGVVSVTQSIGGGAPSTGTPATGGALPSAWSGARLYLNSRGTSGAGYNSFLEVKVAARVRSLDYMREAF